MNAQSAASASNHSFKSQAVSKFAITLRRDNHHFWQYTATLTLTKRGLLTVVMEDVQPQELPEPLAQNATPEQKEAHQKQTQDIMTSNAVLTEKQNQAADLIANSVSEEILVYIMNDTNPFKQWKKLAEFFASTGATQRQFYIEEMRGLEFYVPMVNFLEQMKLLSDKIKGCGGDVSEHQLCSDILLKIPDDYKTSRDVLLANSNEMTYEKASATLTDAEHILNRKRKKPHQANTTDIPDSSGSAGNTAHSPRAPKAPKLHV
jgi:hypothetical protein